MPVMHANPATCSKRSSVKSGVSTKPRAPQPYLCFYHRRFGASAQHCRPRALFRETCEPVTSSQLGDRQFQSDASDANSGCRFLIDTGAEISVFPPGPAQGPLWSQPMVRQFAHLDKSELLSH